MRKIIYIRKIKNFLVFGSIALFFITIAIPRLGHFYVADKNYKFVGFEETTARKKSSNKILYFASGSEKIGFNISNTTIQKIVVNGVEKEIEISDTAVILDGEPLVLSGPDNRTLVSTEIGYREFTPESIDFEDDLLEAPNVDQLSDILSLARSSRRAESSTGIFREIDFRVISAPDYSSNKSDQQILSSALKNIYLANQYLKALNLVVVLKDLKVFREHEGFFQAIEKRDPYRMLEKTADEHNFDFNSSIDITATFSNTYFPNASGLAYAKTSCINPHYSVLFVTQGGTSLSQELSLPSTLAHEIGHIIGMEHDLSIYGDLGASLMTKSTSVFPFGFSQVSIQQQRAFSSSGNAGGACFNVKSDLGDSDSDGVSDELESSYGTDPNDPGSFPRSKLKRAFASWNGFKGQTSVGEILGSIREDNNLSINIRNLNGEILSAKQISLARSSELDIIFSDLLPEFTDTYGIVEIVANSGSFHGLSNTYAHTGTYGTFNYISKQAYFHGSKFEESIPFNSFTPYSFPQGSEVLNWLSVGNLNGTTEDFEITRLTMDGQVSSREFLSVPAMGRRDVLAGGPNGLLSGSVNVRPVDFGNEELLFHSFISRYYSKPRTGLTGSVIVDGTVGSDVDRVIVLDNDLILSDKMSNTWLEVSNTSRISGALTLTQIDEANNESVVSVSMKPYQTVHLPLTREGLMAYRISSTVPYTANGFRYKGERGTSTVQRYLPQEFYSSNLSGSLNTFLNSSSYLYVFPESTTKETLYCRLIDNNRVIEHSVNLAGSRITKVSLESLFPEAIKDSYYNIACGFNNAGSRSVMFIGRIVDSKHSSIEPMQ